MLVTILITTLLWIVPFVAAAAAAANGTQLGATLTRNPLPITALAAAAYTYHIESQQHCTKQLEGERMRCAAESASFQRTAENREKQWTLYHNAAMSDATNRYKQAEDEWEKQYATSRGHWATHSTFLRNDHQKKMKAMQATHASELYALNERLDLLQKDVSLLTKLLQKKEQELHDSSCEVRATVLDGTDLQRQYYLMVLSNNRLRSIITYWHEYAVKLEKKLDAQWGNHLNVANERLLARTDKLTRTLCASEMTSKNLRRQIYLLKHLQMTEPCIRRRSIDIL